MPSRRDIAVPHRRHAADAKCSAALLRDMPVAGDSSWVATMMGFVSRLVGMNHSCEECGELSDAVVVDTEAQHALADGS